MKSHFEIFKIPQSYSIDLEQLENQYLQLQKEFHPDKLVNKSEGERLVLANLSADVNDAYQVLKSPLHRAEYLLELNKIIVNIDGKDSVKPTQSILLDAMQMRENLEDYNSKDELKNFEAEIKSKIKVAVTNIEQFFASELNAKNLEITALETIKLKYLTKFLEDIKTKVKSVK